MVNEKCQRWSQAVADDLALLLGSLYSTTVLYDTNSDVYVKVALVAGGSNSVKALISIKPGAAPASGAYDSLGLTQTVYTPHIIRVMIDRTTPFSAGTTLKELETIAHELDALGVRIQWYSETASGSNIAIADLLSASSPDADLSNIDLRNGTLSNL